MPKLLYSDRYKDKIEYEMDYWVKNGIRLGTDKYVAYLEEFGLAVDSLADKSFVDVGCGPFGGITHVVNDDYFTAIAVDPLFPHYERAGILNLKPGVCRMDFAAEEMEPRAFMQMDYVFSCNALDHSPDEHTDNTAQAVENMLGILAEGGKLCIYVHLRGDKELDYGHDFPMTLEKITDAVGRARTVLNMHFDYERLDIKTDDPINKGKCRTAVAVINRRRSD
jgi:SAM-dependent methyltransferase